MRRTPSAICRRQGRHFSVGIGRPSAGDKGSSSSPPCAQKHPGCNPIPRVLDEFTVHGPNGVHTCYTTEPARCNLHGVSLSRLFFFFFTEVARALVGGLTLALAYTHLQGYVHGGLLVLMFFSIPRDIRLISKTTLDVHLQNILVKIPSSFHQLSSEQLYEKYGKSELYTITQRDGKPISSPNIPQQAVVPLYLGKPCS